MSVRLGVDIGGTFTDLVLYDESSGRFEVTKTPSTPDGFAEGVIVGIEKILGDVGVEPEAVTYLSHGTTVGTNAVLEEDLPPLGLITNEGLRDVVEIGDQTRPELYNLQTEKPPALVPRRLRKEVPGRIDASGEVVDGLDEERVRDVVDELADEDIESIIVSMLFSFLNADQERRVGELIEAHDADIPYTLSSEVYPEVREYDRTITTILNEAISVVIRDYMERLEAETSAMGIQAPLNVMHSGGGILTGRQAVKNAVRTVLSGPTAGAVAAESVSLAEGYENAIGMDMGGTSCDVSILLDGELLRTTEGEINDLPVKTPMIDVSTVGAGGGSIAWIDEGGALRVGPESAGATPGPICYGQGGARPTVTDVNVILGRLNPDYFLGGEMDLAVDRALELFQSTIAEPIGQPVEDAALSVLEVATARLVRQIRRVTVERGYDPGAFALTAFGGAGPMQAPLVAGEMDIGTVIVPRDPGVFSARGLLIADVRSDVSHHYRAATIDPERLRDQYETLEGEITEQYHDQGFAVDDLELNRAADIRYQGQAYELTVPVPGGGIDADAVDEIASVFHQTHEQRYGYSRADEPIEIVTLRVEGRIRTPTIEDGIEPTDEDPYRGEREVYFPEGGHASTEIYERTALDPGMVIEGPAVLEEVVSTTLVPPETRAEVTEYGNVVISL